MRDLWRTLVLWLLVLALPAQALAGARLMHCQLQGTVAPVAVHHHEPLADGIAPSLPNCNEHASDTVHRCSACAACNLGTALTPAAVRLPEAVPSPAPAFGATGAIASHIASGLERPPRAASA